MVEEIEVPIRVTTPIVKGSIVLVSDSLEHDEVLALQTQLRHITGHDKFLIVMPRTGTSVSVHGPDELKDVVRSLVQEQFDNLLKELRTHV